MTDRLDLGAAVGGVTLPFCAMNAPEACATAGDVRALAGSRSGAVVLHSATVHPFVHPEFRSLHNPGFDKLVPLARELVAAGRLVVASVAGSNADELALLARAFAEGGVVAVEANLAEPWVEATLGPFADAESLRALVVRLVEATPAPLWVRLPDRPLAYSRVIPVLAEAGVRAVSVRNEFTTFERLLLETGAPIDVIALGNVRSGYDVRRALAKGAKAVQVGPTLGHEGAGIFARLERELLIARGQRPRG